MELVNGYYCRDCAEVELAKKGIDPAKAKDPINAAEAAASLKQKDQSKLELGVNRVSASGDVGTRLSLYA